MDRRRIRRLLDYAPARGRGRDFPKGKSKMDFEKTVAGINQLAAKISRTAKLPDTVTEEDFDTIFGAFVHILCGSGGKDTVRHDRRRPGDYAHHCDVGQDRKPSPASSYRLPRPACGRTQ